MHQTVPGFDWLKISPWLPKKHSIKLLQDGICVGFEFSDDAIMEFELSRFFTRLHSGTSSAFMQEKMELIGGDKTYN